jgi:hypothetical protein
MLVPVFKEVVLGKLEIRETLGAGVGIIGAHMFWKVKFRESGDQAGERRNCRS